MLTDVLSVDLEKSLADVDDWLSDYIGKPHSLLGRGGAACPSAGPSRGADSLEIRLCLVGVTPSVNLLAETVRCALDEFGDIQWPSSNSQLWSVLLVFPDLAPE